METDCNSEFGRSPEVSEEDEEEPQERGQLSNSLKNCNQDEVVKSKLSDSIGIVQDEDNGLTWEANSSRCSTSQASETSATSGVYSLENSYMDSPSEIDDGKFDRRRTNNSPNQEPLSPNRKIDPDRDYCVRQMQEKGEDTELDPANPKSWPYQVQPSKIKDYLVQITQEVVPSLQEEKDNALKKKGELPLEGTVRARIQLITAVLEERHKKIFRRVNKKDLPPPPPAPIIRRPREPPKIFSRQGIFVPLRHVEKEATDKNNKKELVHYNLKHVQTNVSNAGASVPNTVKKRTRRSFLSETQNKASEKLPSVSPPITDKANKSDIEPYSGLERASFTPTDHEDKMEKKERRSVLPDKDILEKACNLLDETKKPELQHYVPDTTVVTDISEESSSLPERTIAKPFTPVSVEPLSDSTNEPQNQFESTVTVLSDPTAQDKQPPNNFALMEHEPEQPILSETRNEDIEPHPSQPEIKDAAVLHSAEEARKQDISPYPPAVAESAPEQVELSHSVRDTEKQEIRQVEVEYSKKEGEQSTRILQAEPEQQHLVCSGKEAEAREMEMVLDFPPAASRTETQESQHYSYKAAEEYSGPLQPTCLMGEAEKTTEQLQFNLAKEDVKTATALTSSQEPECLEESHLRGDLENQTAPLESQHSDLSLSSPEAQREEIHQHSITIAQPESEHPVISEPVKAPLRSKHGKLSQLGGKEASSCSPAEAVDSSEQLPFNSTALTEMVEKEESQPSTLITATPLLEEQPGSDLPDRSEQMEKQDSAPCSPETPTLVSDASLSAVLVQPADVTKVETEQYSPTQAPSEASVSVSRESDVAAERETIQPDSLLCVKSPPEASVPFQEAVKLENQVSPPINTTLYSEDEDRTHPSRDEGQQEGNVHLLGTTQFEWESSAEFEARIHNIQENSSALPQLEETLALHSVDEAEKDMHSDKSIPEPSHPDSLYSICVPEEQERMQSEMGQTVQHLSSAVLQTESDILPLVKEIDGMPVHLPAATQDVLKPACLTETQEDKGLPTGMATLDSGCLGIPSTVAGAELESKHRAKQIIQTITTEPELDYPKVLPSVSESDLETSFPAPSADFQAHMLVTPQSEEEHPVSSEKEREDIEQDSSITPTPEPIIPTTGPEIQESQSSSSDVLTEVPKPSPIILSFLPVQIKDQELPAEPILTSIPPSEQSNLQSPDLKDKAEIEKSQFPFPEMPKTGPQESVSATTFLIGETTDEAFYSPRDTQIVPEEPSVPEDFASEAIKEMNLPSSLSPAGSFSEESISLYAVDGEKQERSHALLTAESKQLAAGKADIHAVHSHPLATAQSEAKNLDVEPYCPVTTQSEQEDLTLLSKEEIMKQETPLHSFSIVESEPIDQELLHDMGKRDDQEKSPLETDISKVQNAPLLSPVQQQVSEHLNLLQSVEQSEMKEIQPSSFSAVHDSSQRATKTETGICQGSLSTTAENDGGVFVLSEFTDEAAKPEIQPLWNEAAQLECQQPDVSAKEKEQIPFPPATAPQDQGHVGLFSSTEPQLSSPEAQNQTSEQPPSASPLHPEKVKKQEVNSLSPSVLISPALGQSNSVLRDHIEETEQQKIQSYPPVVENVILEEPLSIAAFLLSEAKEIQTSLPLTTEEDHLDVQPLFEEAGLLIDSSADLLEVNGTIKKEIQPSLTHFESQQLSSKPQAEVTHLEKREDIPDIPTTPSFIVNQPSYALLSEPINVTYTQNIPSPISSVDSDEIKGKEAAVTAEDLSKKEEIPCLSSAKKTLQESENNLQKEKELNHQEKLREESVSAPDSSNTSELVRSNTSEDYQVVSIYAHPFISSADGEENKHMPERLEYLETVSSLKTKPCHDVGDVIVTHESSVCNVSTDILEGLTEDVHENKANASTEMVVEVRVQRNVETEKEASACHEKNDSALNVTDMDYVEKYTLITDRSFTQTGKEQSVEVAQRLFDVTKENSEEATAPPASSKNTLDSFLLERDLDEDFHDMVKGENTVKEEETSKISKENESIDAVRKNKEDELILADTPLCSTEKDEVAHSPLTPMRDTTLNPDLLEMPPALSFIYQDLYEEVKAELKNDSCRHPSSEETENDGGVFVLSEFTNEAAKPEIQPLWNEAAQLECQQPDVSAKEKEQIPFPPATVPQDQGHVGLFSSTEPQLSSPEAQNQISEQPPSASPLHPEKVKKQEVNSLSPSVSISPALGQSNSVLQDHIEETEQQKIQSYPPVVENVILEEPLSIAAFLLSEAKEIQTSLPLTTEEDHLDIQPLFEEAGLLIDSSADLLEVNGTIKKEIQPPLTHFESQQLSSKPQAEVTHLEKREDIPDMPTTPSFIVNQPSYALLSEPINVTYTQNIPSPISSVDSDEIKGKEAAVTAEDLSKKEEIPCLSSAKKTLQESENNLQKEKELNHQKKLREESVSAPDSSNTSELVHSNTSEDYQVVSIYAHPFVSSADGEENKHMPERLEYLETVSSLKTKPCHDVGGVIVTHESSVCNVSTDILEGLTEDVHENKANASTEMVVEVRVQRNVETEKEASACHEKNDSALNVTDMDYVEKYTLITDRSFTQTGKEQSVEVAQRLFDVTKENSEEATAPPASSKNTLDSFLLERDLDEDFHDMVKGENTVKEEETSKISKENESIDAVRKNKEDELILAETRLCSAEKDEVAHSPLTPMRDTTLNTDLLEMPPALSFLYQDLYEEVKAELKNDSCRHPSSEETENTNVPLHSSDQVTNDGTGIYFEKDIPKDGISNDLEESQKEQFLKDQPINEQALSQTRVSEGVREPNEKEQDVLYSLTEVQAQSQFVSPRDNVEGRKNALLEGPTEIASDVKVTTCQPALAIPFGSRLYGSGASNDEGSQSRGEDDLSAEAGHALPEETSDEESSPILDYAATLYPEEAPVQDETMDATCLTADQPQQSEVTEVLKEDNYAVIKPVAESTELDETVQEIRSPWENEELEDHFSSDFTEQDVRASEYDHPTGSEAEERVDEHFWDLTAPNKESASRQYAAPEVKSDTAFGELDYSLLSHDFDTYPLYSIKEEEYSDIDEDLAELMDYEMVAQDDVFREETSSEVAREDDRKSLDHISNTYKFVNEREADTYAEEEEFELMGLEKLQKNVPQSEVLQKETEQAQFDAYCNQCKCLICADDKLSGDHKEHHVANLDTAATELKGQLGRFLDVLQERSLKIEGFVSEIEALFNSLEENCKGKEQLLEEQNESIINAVIAGHDKKAQSFEDRKNTKMEYLYEQMVNFQEYIDTAKETLETIVKETEEMDDFVFLRSSEDINKRLLSAVENILILEKMPASFSQFEHYADSSANGDQTLQHMPVPQTPKLQQQDPNSATSTSIAVYWTVSEEDVIDFFQVYCMEEHPENKEQSGLVEEYRVTVKESNCTLEDLEPGHCYSVWIMAVNYTGCSFPSNKFTFRTAPPTPVIKAEDCTVCWDTATIRWSTSNSDATESFTLEYCRQYSPEGEGLRSLAGIKRTELKVKLEPNVNYFFYVRAVNIFGTSEQSEAALISTKGSRFHIMKETAHPPLQVSANGTMICLPEEANLTGIPPVLGELLSAHGWHYWEITVSGCNAYKVGICCSTAPPDNVLGQNKTSWCLHCSSKASLVYKVLHNGEMSDVIVTEQPVRIGILLDYSTGRLLFFNAERGQVLFAVRQKFTSAAHPAFVLEQPGVLNLHTGMELPEFVKYS